MWRQHSEQLHEIVGLGNRQAELLDQRFEILLRRLLAKEADLIRQGLASGCETCCGQKIGVGLANPLACPSFHRELCPWLQFR